MESVPYTCKIVRESNALQFDILCVTDEAFIQLSIPLPHGFGRVSGAPKGPPEFEISLIRFQMLDHVKYTDVGILHSLVKRTVPTFKIVCCPRLEIPAIVRAIVDL